MKIQANGIGNVYKKKIEPDQKQEQASKTSRAPGKTDSIQISSLPERSTPDLVESLKAQILKDVKAGIGSHRLEDLKMEIASGNYDSNPADIVYKIMGEQG